MIHNLWVHKTSNWIDTPDGFHIRDTLILIFNKKFYRKEPTIIFSLQLPRKTCFFKSDLLVQRGLKGQSLLFLNNCYFRIINVF